VNGTSVGGTATGPVSPICYNTSTTISLNEQVGSIVKWQSAANNGSTWTDIAGSAGVNPLATGNLTVPTLFRAVVQLGVNPVAYSSVAEVDIETTHPSITSYTHSMTGVVGAGLPDFTASMVVNDDCGGVITKSQSPAAGTIISAVGTYSVALTATNAAGNHTTVYATYTATYQPSGSCGGIAGHTILQPINADGSSVCKQGSTVPAKFRVYDANCNSIGTAGVVASFRLMQTISGTLVDVVNEPVDSTTPDANFRWDASGQQWIFNISTKSLAKNKTYVYLITLNDGSTIGFQFGLR